MPLQTADLLVGKVGWILLGTYSLFLLLTLSGALLGDARVTYRSNDFAPRLDLAITWLMPIPFLVVGVLCSLVLRDVLTTVAVAGIATTVLLGSFAGQHQVGLLVCFAALAVVDVLAAPAWLRDGVPSWQTWLRRSGAATAAHGHSTFSVRSQSAWRRTASSLIWKEWHQAIGLTLTLAIGGAVVISVVAFLFWQNGRNFELSLASLLPMLLLALPLVFGVAAGHSDRRDGAFRLLAHRGVSPSALLADEARGLARTRAGDLLRIARLGARVVRISALCQQSSPASVVGHRTLRRARDFSKRQQQQAGDPGSRDFRRRAALFARHCLCGDHPQHAQRPRDRHHWLAGTLLLLVRRRVAGVGRLVVARHLAADLSVCRLGADARLARRSQFSGGLGSRVARAWSCRCR